MCVKCELNDPGTIKELNDPGLIFIVIQVKESQGYIHRRTGRGAGGGFPPPPPHFSDSWDFIRAFLPKKHPTVPEFSGNFLNSKFWVPPDPPFHTFYEYLIRIPRVCLYAKNLRAPKIDRFGQFEVRYGHFWWFVPPFKISPCAYGYIEHFVFHRPSHSTGYPTLCPRIRPSI